MSWMAVRQKESVLPARRRSSFPLVRLTAERNFRVDVLRERVVEASAATGTVV